MEHDQELRNRLLTLLKGGEAFDRFEDIVKGVPPAQRGVVPPDSEHSAWQIVSHMQIALRDALDWTLNEDGHYQDKDWPEEYWPKAPGPPNDAAWDKAIEEYLADRSKLEELARTGDLFKPFTWEPKHDLLRQILLAADHAAYHCGQLVLVSEVMSNA